jgi:hypothetical protein
MPNLPPKTRIRLPSGRTGVIVVPDGGKHMPLHCLVELDQEVHGIEGDRQWFLGQLCTPLEDSQCDAKRQPRNGKRKTTHEITFRK